MYILHSFLTQKNTLFSNIYWIVCSFRWLFVLNVLISASYSIQTEGDSHFKKAKINQSIIDAIRYICLTHILIHVHSFAVQKVNTL